MRTPPGLQREGLLYNAHNRRVLRQLTNQRSFRAYGASNLLVVVGHSHGLVNDAVIVGVRAQK